MSSARNLGIQTEFTRREALAVVGGGLALSLHAACSPDVGGESLMAETRKTLEAFRKTAETLNARINTVSDGLERFSDRGLADATALINETRRSVNRIERAITDLERNPQRLIFGGEGDVKTYNGRQRR